MTSYCSKIGTMLHVSFLFFIHSTKQTYYRYMNVFNFYLEKRHVPPFLLKSYCVGHGTVVTTGMFVCVLSTAALNASDHFVRNLIKTTF